MRRILITGCSGGGKSTLLAELARRGHATVAEPGRRILAGPDPVDPWQDPVGFGNRALAMATADLAAVAVEPGPVFFDRGTVDAALALERFGAGTADRTLAGVPRYDQGVILAPPWPEIYVTDAARRHGIDAALEEYRHIETSLQRLGYDALMLPRLPVTARADWVLARVTGP